MLGRALVAVCCLSAFAQTPAPPAFEVASVKPTEHGRVNGVSRSSIDIPTPKRLRAENASLRGLLEFAYRLETYQISGPAWLNDDDECFDVDAVVPPGTPKQQFRPMLATLLVQRFHLATHRETRPVPAYNLVPDKRGPRLQLAKPGQQHRGISSQGGDVSATAEGMAFFASWLAREVRRPVFDATGLTGEFDFKFQYDPSNSGNGDRPWLPEALTQQLGLRLESVTKPVEVLIVDHIDRLPVAN